MPPSSVSHPVTNPVNFVPEDFEVLDLALHVSPELRIAAFGLKLARIADVRYPVTSIDEITALIPSGRFEGAGHVVTGESLRIIFPKEFLPIEDETDLLVKTHIALIRCRDMTHRAMTIDPAIYKHVVGDDVEHNE
jgi:hypothetical protein